jgi:outer membrane protein OmpA-like peptidoglycan-associated protein
MRIGIHVAGFVTAALLVSTGCVTKTMFRKNNEATDARTSAVESAVEANERRLADLSDDTDRKLAAVEGEVGKAVQTGNHALERAEAAARGRLLWTVTLSDDRVKFSFDEAGVPKEAGLALDDLARKVRGYDKAVYLEIAGHTDNVGADDYNFELGHKRATAVRDYLSRAGGIPLHAMNTISYGETQPVADNATSDGRAKNRRVVIQVLE